MIPNPHPPHRVSAAAALLALAGEMPITHERGVGEPEWRVGVWTASTGVHEWTFAQVVDEVTSAEMVVWEPCVRHLTYDLLVYARDGLELRVQAAMPRMMTVGIPDPGEHTFLYPAGTVHKATIQALCPACGKARGLPIPETRLTPHASLVHAHTWRNPSGHPEDPAALLVECGIYPSTPR